MFYKLLTFKNIIAAKNRVLLHLRKIGATVLKMRSCAINAAELNINISSQINAVKGMSEVEKLLTSAISF